MKILVLGADGMLGHRVYIHGKLAGLDIFGTVRKTDALKRKFKRSLLGNIMPDVDAYDLDAFEKHFADLKPNVIINCIGLVKQLPESNDPEKAIYLNSLFPHKIARLSRKYKARLVHLSTDCVFSGKSGNCSESDPADPNELYGLSKLLGEVSGDNSVTIRTSLIGHQLKGKRGLLEWFLSQKKSIKGFKNVYFNGLSTNEFARVIFDFILPNRDISGLFNVSSKKISKYDLLCLIARKYKKKIKIIPAGKPVCDRSLNSEKFRKKTGYLAPEREEIVSEMYNRHIYEKKTSN